MTPAHFEGLGDYVGFLPGAALSAFVAAVLAGRVGRSLDVSQVTAWLLMVSIGVVLSATVTPSREALDYGASGVVACDLGRVGLARWREYLSVGTTSLNVLLFVPLGALLGWLPSSRRRTSLVLAAVVLPFAIELLQLAVAGLGRACQSADVVDNLLGLAAGLALGVIAGLAVRGVR